MARGGFLSRITRALKNVVAPRQPPPERPRPEPPRAQGPRDTDYRKAWRSGGGKGNYKKHLTVFHRVVDPVEQDPDEQLELWDSYVRNIVSGRGRARRQSTDNLFWRDSGIDPSDMNWQAWREAMGYTGRRRSRTA
jgi:hypothetical protein